MNFIWLDGRVLAMLGGGWILAFANRALAGTLFVAGSIASSTIGQQQVPNRRAGLETGGMAAGCLVGFALFTIVGRHLISLYAGAFEDHGKSNE